MSPKSAHTPPITLYGIKTCDSCSKARRWLVQQSLAHRFHDLREDGLTIQMLERWSDRLGWEKLLNRASLTWRRLPEADRDNMNRSLAIGTMLEHPTLIKRPVLEHGDEVTVGFSPERYRELLS